MKLFTAPRALLIFLPGAVLVAAGACGYPTFGFDSIGTGTTGMVITGAGSTTGSGGGGGGMGTGGDAATVTATSSTGPGCTIVHDGNQGTCEYLPGSECGCAMADHKCSVATAGQATGASSCVVVKASPNAPWLACDSDSDCQRGTFCDHVGKVCEPMCMTATDCGAPGRRCIAALSTSPPPAEIPGLQLCTAHCDPETAATCGPGTNCVRVTITDFDCTTSAGKIESVACTFSSECTKGLLCIGTANSKTCQRWCHPADATVFNGCPNAEPYCNPFATAVTYDGVPYGYCDTSSKP